MRRVAGGTVVLGILVLLATATATDALARPLEGRRGKGTTASTNWSGYAAYGATFTSARGSWTQPPASCTGVRGRKLALSAFWVGLDGYESGTVEQTGTEADCEGQQPIYYAWYELYPQRPFLIPHEVKPGDQLTAEVTQSTLTLEDRTQKWSASESYLSGGLAFSSAEWIAEAMSKSLTDYGQVTFSSASASSQASTGSIAAFSNDRIVMVDHAGPRATIRSEPGELAAGGSAFSISWLHG